MKMKAKTHVLFYVCFSFLFQKKYMPISLLALQWKDGTTQVRDFIMTHGILSTLVVGSTSIVQCAVSNLLYLMSVVVMIPSNSNLITMNIVLPTLLCFPLYFELLWGCSANKYSEKFALLPMFTFPLSLPREQCASVFPM